MKIKGIIQALLVGIIFCAPQVVFAFCGPITWNSSDAPENALFPFFENVAPEQRSLLLYRVRVDGQCMGITITSSSEDLQQARWNNIRDKVILTPLQPPCSIVLSTDTEAELGCTERGLSGDLYYQLSSGWFFPDTGTIISITRYVGLNDGLPCDSKAMPLETFSAIENAQLDIAKQIVDRKCCPPDKKIPMPQGAQVFTPEAGARPVLGVDPSAINPFGVGKVGGSSNAPSLSVGFCPFEQPVDIVVLYGGGDFEPYTYESDGKAYSSDMFGGHQRTPKAWLTNVPGPVSATLSKDFGGLFPDTGHLPKGSNTFYVLAAPSPMSSAESFYLWLGVVPDVSCAQGSLSLPESQQLFVYQPVAKPVFGLDPATIKPLQIGPAAIGGDDILMAVDFCGFNGPVDVHFGMYCDDDPANIYFLNFSGKDPKTAAKGDVLQKVPLAAFRLPAAAANPDGSFDSEHSSYFAFFVGSLSEQPQGACAYVTAITPKGVQDKFFAWGISFNRNIKSALIDFALKNAAGN